MSYIWKFAPESKPLLQQCLDAAAAIPPDDSNKWLKRFGPRNLELNKTSDHTVLIEDSPEIDINIPQQETQDDIQSVLEEIKDSDFDITKFDIIVNKFSNSPKSLTKIAESLPVGTLEKLVCHALDILSSKKLCLDYYYVYFIPLYIKRDSSRLCTELLLKTYNSNSHLFKILLKATIKDLSIPNSILNDFILTLNADQMTEILNNMINQELTADELIYNLFNIYTAYKSCNKTDTVQNNILLLLKTFSVNCSTDKNYGKLFLAYLQHEKCLDSKLEYTEIVSILEVHKSPFKRLCIAVIEEVNKR